MSIVHGRDLRTSSQSIVPDPIPGSFEAYSAALGIFVHSQDAALQIAVLATDGSVHLLSTTNPAVITSPTTLQSRRMPVATHPSSAWTEIESFPNVAPINPAAPPILFRTRLSGNNADDVMILNSAGGRTAVISHPNPPGPSYVAGTILSRSDSSTDATVALPMRVNIDGRPGVIFLKPSIAGPSAMMPLPDPLFSVNTTADTQDVNIGDGLCADANGNCSLRAAVMEANFDSGNDTILVPAGVYTLTLTGPNKETSGETDGYGSLDIFHGVSIVGQVDGSGNPTTIIQAGTNSFNGIDKVFAINPNSATAFDTSFSNLQIQFGRNPGSFSGGLVMPHGFGGGISWQGNLTGNMTLTNCVITDNSTLDGDGGGIAMDSGGILGRYDGTGVFTITNSTIQRNSANESSTGNSGTGGGIWVNAGTALVMANSQVLNNQATQFSAGGGRGGGIFFGTPANTHTQAEIDGGIISGNQSTGHGAGIYTQQGLRIDQGALIANNFGADQGGGLWTTSNGQLTTLSRITITGNSATSQGGGIFSGSVGSTNQLFITFSRIANNTASLGSNLSALSGTIDATLNWWGTNNAGNTINGAVTFDPYIVLSNTPSPTKILINQTSVLTASFLQENHGNSISSGDVAVLAGLPVTFGNSVLGTISTMQPETLGSGGTATAVFNAGNAGGQGHVDVVIDNTTVTANIVILQPPSITQSISPASVLPSTSSTISLTITSQNSVTVNGGFTDALPAGLLVASPANVVNTCGGTLTAQPGSSSIVFSISALAAGTCNIRVDVASSADGNYNNNVTINSSDAGTGNTASANLTVINPPSIVESFGAPAVALNTPVPLVFTVTNPNLNLTLSGVSFNDFLPAGLVVATGHTVSNSCGGALTSFDGGSSISISGGSVAPASTCVLSITVAGTTAGPKANSVSVSSTNGGNGGMSAASILVNAPPAIQQSFGAPAIPLAGSTGITFILTNPNASTTLTGIGLNDTLPAGLAISTPNGLAGSCGGAVTALPGGSVINLTGGTLSPNTSCSFTLNVTGVAAGDQHNTTGPVSSNEGGAGTAVATVISVVAPATISAVFTPASIGLNTTSSLSVTIKAPAANTVSLTGVALTITLPAGLGATNNTSGVCGGALAITGGATISLSGATIAPNANCQFAISISGAQTGQYTVTTSAIQSANGAAATARPLTLWSRRRPPSASLSLFRRWR